MKLNEANLSSLPADIKVPAYDRSALAPGIVHIGTGNFHRAHMAVYLDDLFGMGLDHDWAILGAGVREGDEKMRLLLAEQDYLSSVTELDPSQTNSRVIGAMPGFVPVDPTNAPLIAAMADPAIRIVSLTVTEGGYFIDPKTNTFSPEHPAIQRDAAHPDTPETAFGAIIAALKARRAAGVQPFTVMCCDNVPHNGRVTRDAVVGLCQLFDADLAQWIKANVAFPNSMVDRITPATGPRELKMVRDLGIEDAAPVTCEPFRQWVVEDNFPAGRPQLEKVGVTFTDAVDAYETMKIRILNGGHAIIAYPGGLKDIHFVHEAMEDDQIRAFLDKVETTEILPIVPPVPDTDLNAYKQLILDRCSNPSVADTVRRLCLDGSNRQPKFIVPSIRDVVAKGNDATGLILLSALWCRYCFGTSENGTEIAPNDPNWEKLTLVAAEAKTNPAAWLAMREVYGDLGENAAVAARFDELLRAVWAEGSVAVIRRYLDGTL
ncbi:mannitol dehydrogenase family protein [Falsirhodobacter sp. 20TX0035]|uniref:mannitol dehydrogenase family protein n=1 Tax=Falsirhodobacter sp. 20TX0035 TaxID=3022019 RepID=UPI00232D07F3|nr:mannitol dehydrogenase family protein [Falsirhodobacter sp. 20TX0035]MDB6453188.1 mannitol dehydrogenase family protein [Falsirhodobacter sp. 20TX0035]